MAVPVKKKFKHYAGDDFRYSFRLEQPADTPMNLTGWTAELRTEPAEVAMTISTPDNTGLIVVAMSGVETRDAEPENVVIFDVALTDTTGFTRTYLKGTISLQQDV